MHLHWLIVFLVLTGQESDAENCNDTETAKAKKRLFDRLSLNENYSQNTRMWPLTFHDDPLDVKYFDPATIFVDIYVTSITNVNEKAQSISTQVKMITGWPNSNMTWTPGQYCGIKSYAAPKNMFWTPDICIMESIKTDFGTKESPYVQLRSEGFTVSTDVLALTTACKMDLYRFPFDTQICNITLQSTVYSDQEIILDTLSDAEWATFKSKEVFQAQGEWDFISINSTSSTIGDDIGESEINQLIYQITIKRRPLLYVINIIIPVFFFLVLDVIASFIDTSGADKVSFKVTLLLSISVMLLILYSTLPSTAENIPLIASYCCAVFCLIGIGILETFLVNCLMARGAEKRSAETTSTVSGRDDGERDQKSPPDSVRDQNEESFTLNRLKQILTECWAVTPPNQRKKLSWTRVMI
ncbi:5-hydroxytryptamine receptor 3A-like [Rhinichthys klamathensis goyatoka]|uniref:5-hydroxytryptamine receptor 3A-like n=1 Tax=Rhinichthys klamathensis goyatoka TaxID=3034132 RepID=UPI0024B4D24A|nr:5-hydroxytryptamine receptor 3A-like [Rhinichthys klamathensis goyatoka]